MLVTTDSFREVPGSDAIENVELGALHHLVDHFTGHMKSRFAETQEEGKSGWDTPEAAEYDYAARIAQAVEEARWVDVANLAAIAWNVQQEGGDNE